MSNLRRLMKIANLNEKLFDLSGDVKDEVINFLFGSMTYDGHSEITPEEKQTMDYPGSPASATIEAEGSISVSALKNQYTGVTDEDINKLIDALNEDSTGYVDGELKEVLKDFADSTISDFNVSDYKFSMQNGTISFTAEAGEIENHTKEDYQ